MTPGHNFEGGWIRIQRGLRDHPVVGFGGHVGARGGRKPRSYSRCEAWLDLLMSAAYDVSSIDIKNNLIELEPGQLVGARGYLADKWGWSEQNVRTFLKRLVTEGMLKINQPSTSKTPPKNNHAPNIITVCNFSKYQIIEHEITDYVEGVKDSKTNQQVTSNQPATNHNITNKQINNINNARAREAAPKNQDQSWAEIIANERGETPQATGVSLQGETVVLMNGTRQKWIELFGDDEKRLDLALLEISAELQPNSGKSLHIDVESRLAKRAAWKRDGDKRYQRRTEPKKSKSTKKAKQPTAQQLRIWAGATE